MSEKEADILEKALTRFLDESMQGRQPDINEFTKQYPQCEAQLKERIQDLREIDFLFDTIVRTDESDYQNIEAGQNLVGQKIGCFEIEEVIGSGGMGIVYLARDTRLNRSVAIKSIPAQLKDNSASQIRFKREAELLASLNHPNIAVIHDIIEQEDGTGYLVLEYVPGQTLAERMAHSPLKLEEALSIACQIAEAVSTAHKKGIIHRDLKPGNIKLTPEGRIKVLDFGLAKSSVSKDTDIQITSTEPGPIIGTPAYMSPELARGTDISHRTDIWSYGCILYQMLTGTIPFEGQTATDTLAHIIDRQPDWGALPKETPESIRVLLHLCLEKDPDERLGDISDAAIEITKILSKPLITPPSKLRKIAMIIGAAVVCIILFFIASKFIPQKDIQSQIKQIRLVVLPFENLGPADDEWFADGMTDEITSRIAGIHGLGVISRQSAIQYKEREKSTPQIAKELSVDYILEGTIQREQPSDPNSLVRIRCQLIKASNDTHVWVQNYNSDMSEILHLQSKVAEQVAQGLDITLIEPERRALGPLPTENVEAYTFYLQGNEFLRRSLSDKDDYEIAINMYEKAVGLDPKFALAYTQLSMVHSQMYWYYHDRSEARLALAKYNVDRAFQINQDLPEAHRALGFYYYWGRLDYNSALEQFAIVQKSLPNDSTLLEGIAYVLRRQEKLEQAATILEKALEFSPRDLGIILNLGETFRHLRKYYQAERYCDLAISLFPDQPGAYDNKAWLYLVAEGDTEKARDFIQRSQINFRSAENPFIFTLTMINMYEGNYQEALDLFSSNSFDFDNLSWFIPSSLRYAQIYGYMKKDEMSKKYYNEARIILESKISERPEDERLHSSLGIAYAGLGRKDDAVEQGKLGAELLPVSKDAMRGKCRIEDLALIYVMVGKYDEAIDELKYLLRTSGQVTIPFLKIEPDWDPIREHPRFKKLIDSDK